jgi:hypothetical protein
MALKDWFVSLWTRTTGAIAKFFEGPGGYIVRQGLGNAIQVAGTVGLSVLLDIAKSKVMDLDASQMTNDSKRIQAIDYLKSYALSNGMTVSESVLRYVLESAVQAVKGEQR